MALDFNRETVKISWFNNDTEMPCFLKPFYRPLFSMRDYLGVQTCGLYILSNQQNYNILQLMELL